MRARVCCMCMCVCMCISVCVLHVRHVRNHGHTSVLTAQCHAPSRLVPCRNEIRAALSTDNMVGLCYIYDPTHCPSDHRDAARQLAESFGLNLVCAVFELSGPDKVDGRLLVTDEGKGSGAERLLTFDEFVEQQSQRKHQGVGAPAEAPASP
jgi:hypothetical protein